MEDELGKRLGDGLFGGWLELEISAAQELTKFVLVVLFVWVTMIVFV